MSVAESFDVKYPSLNRKDTMSLSTINPNDAPMYKFKQMHTNRDWSVNLYNLDIKGASPQKFGIYTQKVDFINKNDDIERSNTKLLHYKLIKPEYNLSNADIEKSSPKMANFKSVRCTNPLEPKYKLPFVEELPPELPRFIRDNIDVRDIEGARPKKKTPWVTKETFPLDNHGVEGSKPKKPYIRNSKYNYIDYSDLTKDQFRTTRHLNPLDPVYELKYKSGEHEIHGLIEKSKPQTFNPFRHPDPFGLKVNDINGASAGSLNKILKYSSSDYNLTTRDIRGTAVGSLRRGIITERQTNPLTPKYKYIGHIELGGDNNNPYGKTFNQLPTFKRKEAPKIQTPQNEVTENAAKLSSPKVLEEEKKIDKMTNDNINFYSIEDNDKVVFDPEKYKKPDPNYAVVHDEYLSPSANNNEKKNIEHNKIQRLLDKTITKMNKAKRYDNNITKPETQSNEHDINKLSRSRAYNSKFLFNRTPSCDILHKGRASIEQRLDKFIENNKI